MQHFWSVLGIVLQRPPAEQEGRFHPLPEETLGVITNKRVRKHFM